MKRWYTYILYSTKINKYYVGVTEDLNWRLERHNMGWGKYTKSGIPWEIVYYETYNTKSEALKREREIKNKKSRKYIEALIQNAGGRPE
uniref:GIY-YIG nuclease family protein n=1 Tax=Ignavibacterium album TaxID=591197 RepID=A0A832DG00_9BACT